MILGRTAMGKAAMAFLGIMMVLAAGPEVAPGGSGQRSFGKKWAVPLRAVCRDNGCRHVQQHQVVVPANVDLHKE